MLDWLVWLRHRRRIQGHIREIFAIWATVIDGSLDTLSYDDTFEIGFESECMTEGSEIGFMPNQLCIHRNSTMHSFFEGEYVRTSVRGHIYTRADSDGNVLNIYLWYFGELSDRHEWWVISSHNLSISYSQNYTVRFRGSKTSDRALKSFKFTGMAFGQWPQRSAQQRVRRSAENMVSAELKDKFGIVWKPKIQFIISGA